MTPTRFRPLRDPQMKTFAALLLCVLFGAQCRSAAEPSSAASTQPEPANNSVTRPETPETQTRRAAARNGAPDVQPKGTGSLAALAPSGMKLVSEAEGDLNGDSKPDAVGVFEKASAGDDQTPRLLVIALRGADGGLRKAAESERVALCRGCGGMLDDPLLNLGVERGAVVIAQSVMTGGGEQTFTLRFGQRKADWLLLGSTIEKRDKVAETTEVRDSNYMTGATVIETRGRKGDEVDAQLSRRTQKEAPLMMELAAFDINDALKGSLP